MEKGKTGRYLKYAIGEIVLVVIGILIALQINNWNEEQKQKQLEIATLKEIKSNLEKNILWLEENADYCLSLNEAITQILSFCENQTPYRPEMDSLFSLFHVYSNISFERTAYENLKVVDANLISNDSLKNAISNIFEIELKHFDPYIQARNDRYNANVVLPLQNKYFSRHWKAENLNSGLHPINYESMIKDVEFFNMCTELAYRRKQTAINSRNSAQRLKQVVHKINEEIRLNK
ncbi:DUF6090 family protein [Winogradskyella sp.]|uniref:DUF6090 family protein n=1 Tax=Winogradskyella sp. TaxID=1883156 RepID=UPI001B120FB7|nr:DUF6090 family protein [Winogradskyella sp.]MBO6879519.1 hypothetical protein [Winogradskyella sp.]